MLVENATLIVLGLTTAIFGAVLVVLVIFPRYRDPSARLFTSKLGYAGIARKLGKPFSVSAATVRYRELTATYQGDGTVRSEPLQVPIIPMGTILKVHADVGDHVTKGQLLVEIDARRAEVKAERRPRCDRGRPRRA